MIEVTYSIFRNSLIFISSENDELEKSPITYWVETESLRPHRVGNLTIQGSMPAAIMAFLLALCG